MGLCWHRLLSSRIRLAWQRLGDKWFLDWSVPKEYFFYFFNEQKKVWTLKSCVAKKLTWTKTISCNCGSKLRWAMTRSPRFKVGRIESDLTMDTMKISLDNSTNKSPTQPKRITRMLCILVPNWTWTSRSRMWKKGKRLLATLKYSLTFFFSKELFDNTQNEI